MITEDQTATIDFLGAPSTYGVATVDRLETHASIVFLAGERAYKLKRAVRFDYLDFSTVERRRAMCEAEVRLNRRTAPMLYRGVVAVTRHADGSLVLGGDGVPVEWLVAMNRFDQRGLFDRLAVAGELTLEVMPPLAAAIAAFHASAERRTDLGGKAGMSWVIEGNAAGFAEFGADLNPSAVKRVTDHAFRELERRGEMLERRRQSGLVRQCHGDLHLRNIVLLEGRPTVFDGVEFNDKISCTDVVYDLAFLVMDLWRRGLRQHANAVLNRYLVESGEWEAVCLLPLFLSCRAAVRAKTSVTAASQVQNDKRRLGELQATAREYLTMAEQFLHPPPACLVAVGGLSGSGKSTLALSVAPAIGAAPGAVVLRSDETRKQLAGVPLLERLGADGYSSRMSERVYNSLAERAVLLLRAGHSVVVDAVFARPSDREAIERVAAAASVPFMGLWLDAPDSVLISRTDQRRNDPSDADAAVIRAQRGQDTGQIQWLQIDASNSPPTVFSNVMDRVRDHLRHAFNGATPGH